MKARKPTAKVALSANEVVLLAAACAASSTPYELHTEHRALLSARQLLSPPLRPLGVPLSRLPQLPRVPRPRVAQLLSRSPLPMPSPAQCGLFRAPQREPCAPL